MTRLRLALALGVLALGASFATAARAGEEAPSLPAYFSGANADPAKPTWPDPTGAGTGVWAAPAGDGKGDTPSSLGVTDLYDRIAHNLVSINVVWTLLAGFLVMFMQGGFMLVETGLCRAKNAAHTAAMNFLVYPLGCLAFWAYGFAVGWGNWFNGPGPAVLDVDLLRTGDPAATAEGSPGPLRTLLRLGYGSMLSTVCAGVSRSRRRRGSRRWPLPA